MNILADTVRRFDVMAIQGVQGTSSDVVPRFVDLVNSTGRHYEYVVGPRLGRGNDAEQYAILFDGASIEVDRAASTPYTTPTTCCAASRWSPGSASVGRSPVRPSRSR